MRAPCTQLYLHLIWATWDCFPLISSQTTPRLFAALAAKCSALKCELLALNGTEDHIHLLVRFHTTVSVAHLVKEIKGSSSHLMTHEISPGEFFKWQGAYSAFTIRKSDVPVVSAYIAKQKEHHAHQILQPEWELTRDTESSAQADFANVAAISIAKTQI